MCIENRLCSFPLNFLKSAFPVQCCNMVSSCSQCLFNGSYMLLDENGYLLIIFNFMFLKGINVLSLHVYYKSWI